MSNIYMNPTDSQQKSFLLRLIYYSLKILFCLRNNDSVGQYFGQPPLPDKQAGLETLLVARRTSLISSGSLPSDLIN